MTNPRASIRCAIAILLGFALGAVSTGTATHAAVECKGTLAENDLAAIKAVIEKYRTSWLRNDAEGVLSTFTDDAVLLPHHGDAPVVGREAIRKYWFPSGATPVKITKLNITVEQLGGDGQLAYVRGLDEVAWAVEENGAMKTYGNAGTYLNVVRKMPDGSWRMTHHMWDDPATRPQ